MIWGKTYKDRTQKSKLDVYVRHFWFAYWPIHLQDGRWVWLETVFRQRIASFGEHWWKYDVYKTERWKFKLGEYHLV